MIFHEMYSAYYTAVSHILRRAVAHDLTAADLRAIVEEHAFSESALTIIPALKEARWPLLHPDMTTPLAYAPGRPMTLLERRWLKSLLLDPRARLFDITCEGLEDIPPLFTPDDIRVYDKYADGDPFGDEAYIARFRLLLQAVRAHTPVWITMLNRRGNRMHMGCQPERLEYSAKDDKFRLIISGCRYAGTVNLGRIMRVQPFEGKPFVTRPPAPPTMQTVILRVTDNRNALERTMLHFAHYEKRAERIGPDDYRLTVRYFREDEKEMLVRILSFGPYIQVEAPDRMIELVRDRLREQMNRGIR